MAKAFRVTKTGDWKLAAQKVKNITPAVDDAIKATLMQATLKGEAIVKKHLRNQDLRWRPLSKPYLRKKLKNNQSEKILIATSTYFQAITRFVSGKYGYVGVKRGVMTDDGEEELANIAMIHEFGSLRRGIRARKLWRPSLLELKEWIKSSGVFVKEAKKRI